MKKSIRYLELIEKAKSDTFTLPEIQRQFVWDSDQVAQLWDSIYHGFPIGQLLFWSNNTNIPTYDFCDSSAKDSYLFVTKKPRWVHDKKAKASNIMVLDGQQRITSLFLGVRENGVLMKTRANSPAKRKYLSLYVGDGDADGDNDIALFDWKEKDSDKDYISIVDALNSKRQHKNVRRLKTRLRDSLSVDYLDGHSVSDVVEIFRRLNNGGKAMNRSELFLAMWLGSDSAKGMSKSLNELRASFGSEFNVQDSTITQILGLIFSKDYRKISKDMPTLIGAVKETRRFLNEDCGIYSNSEMTSHSLFIPLVYLCYKFKCNIPDKLKSEMRCFAYRALAFSLFEKSTNYTLKLLKDTIDNLNIDDSFIDKLMPQIKEKCFGDIATGNSEWLGNEVEKLLGLKKGAKTGMLLLLLKDEPANMNTNPDAPVYEQDHLIAEHLFNKNVPDALNRDSRNKYGIRQNNVINEQRLLSKAEIHRWRKIISKRKYQELKDTLPNLWLLEESRNASKGEKLLNYWYEDLPQEEQKSFWNNAILEKHDIDYLKITNFTQIYNDRKELLQKKLCKLLKKP